jgi:hypothetical protein
MTTGKNSSSTRPVSSQDEKREAEHRRILEQARSENAKLREQVATGLSGLRKIAGR